MILTAFINSSFNLPQRRGKDVEVLAHDTTGGSVVHCTQIACKPPSFAGNQSVGTPSFRETREIVAEDFESR